MGYGDKTTHKVALCERQLEARRKSTRAIALALRYWVSGKLTNERAYIHKAYHTAATMQSIHFGSAELLLLCAFCSVELEEADAAREQLARLKPYRPGWKHAKPFLYGAYTYVSARLELLNGKPRAAKKHRRALAEQNESYNLPMLDMLIGELDLHLNEPESAFEYLTAACDMIEKSPFLFLAAKRYFAEADRNAKLDGDLLFYFLRWGLAQGLDLTMYLRRLQIQTEALILTDVGFGRKLYAAYSMDWMLECICERMLEDGDMSETAFYYYKEAEAKQLSSPQLNDSLMHAAYVNGIESLSRHSLEKYLKDGAADWELNPFLYHLLLTNPVYAPLAEQMQNQMLQFACYGLENRLTGREYYTLYSFLLQKAEDGLFTDAALIDVAENLIKHVLFTYELTVSSPRVRHVWVFEREKKESKAYEVKNGIVKLTAASPQFAVHCFGEGMRVMLETKITRRRLVENVDERLYLRFFRTHFTQTELLIALSRFCMGLEDIPDEYTAVLEKTLTDTDVSRNFRMQAAAALGRHYAARGDYAGAAERYRDLDENALDGHDIEQMLLVHINTKDFERASKLIMKKAECITDRNLFYALKQIAALGTYNERIADVAYELILKSWYDKTLIGIVLKHYRGSQMEWQALSGALAAMSVSERSLDEIILKNAITMHMPDAGAQRVFVRMCEMDAENPLASDFAMYLAYEIIINGLAPVYEAVACMERLYICTDEHMLAYALAHTYLQRNTKTAQSDDILARAARHAEADGFIFPVLKQMKDKSIVTPYIEKNQPFLYRTTPGKKVLLSYRTDADAEPREKPMRYVRFGLYITQLPHFFDETITYSFREQMPTGSVSSKESVVKNTRMSITDVRGDSFYVINEALIHEQMFKYEKVEQIITERLKERPRVKGWIV